MLTNTQQSFGLISILLHWSMAILVLFLFGLGLYMVDLGYYDPWYHKAPDLHRNVGLAVFFLLVFRWLWRLLTPVPSPLENHTSLERIAAKIAHYAFYVLLLLLSLSGYFISTAKGSGIDWFSLMTIPALPYAIELQEDIAGEIHTWLAWLLIFLVIIHTLAALKHHFIDHDKTLLRMIIPSKSPTNGE